MSVREAQSSFGQSCLMGALRGGSDASKALTIFHAGPAVKLTGAQ